MHGLEITHWNLRRPDGTSLVSLMSASHWSADQGRAVRRVATCYSGEETAGRICRTALRESYGDLTATGSGLRREYRGRRSGAAACDRSDEATRCSERVAIAIIECASWRTAPVIGQVGSRPVD